MVLFSILLVKMRVLDSGWNEGEPLYLKTEQLLLKQGSRPDAVVMVRNPPAYFVMTGRQAIVVPFRRCANPPGGSPEIQCILCNSRTDWTETAHYLIYPNIRKTIQNFPPWEF